MELAQDSSSKRTPLGWVLWGVLLAAALYSIYLVIHPFTPLSKADIPILDIVQLERAVHVFFLMFAGYLITARQTPHKRTLGSWVFALLSLVFLYTFWVPNVTGVNIPLAGKLVGTLAWALAVLPALLPNLGRVSDILAALLSIAPLVYQMRFYEELVYRAVIPAGWDMAMSFSIIVLVLGLVYRLLGPVMPSLVLIFLAYNLYGQYVPGTFRGAKNGIDLILGKTYNETEAGIYGLITGVSAKYLVYFTILSGLIGALGLGRIVANLALAMVGRTPMTPGRATGIASVFMGMFSGSGAADTQFVATLTKPLYERAGYDRMIGAGLVATAGTIALITPPVLGSIAFVMVEILQIPYLTVVIMAIGPCLLYLLSVLAFNEFYARKAKLPPVGAELEMSRRRYILRYSTIFLPILLIIAMLYRGFEVSTAVSLAMLGFVLITYLDPTLRPRGLMPILDGLADGFRQLIPIGTAIVAANLIFGMMVITGLPSKFSIFLGQVSGESLLLATAVTAIFSLILGMGIPPTATYVLTSSLTAPAIVKIAEANGIPAGAALLATHMFLFYYAVLADVTPPVALSAYAAASVFKTNPLVTGIYAARVALSKYLVGFFFLFAFAGTGLLILPVLQDATLGLTLVQKWGIILERFLAVGVGIIFLAASTVGYTRRTLQRWESWVLGILGIACFTPSWYINLVAGGLGLLWFFILARPESKAEPSQQAAD
ncbi:TRAP transporter permease [Calidithermus roseus]|uniref:TRAP transporter, 4TM/12TM fusion protein n=1 Tax=Calidithermus roseus TaxID=1644118 RepID=A0A399EX23_9DEIN|nr:TRAP transporter fused permease subunit [Calidithermus roseus]RIH88210.1 TRAP transporter, 4TM/12TM fusion protein [Calidithermus roseus]